MRVAGYEGYLVYSCRRGSANGPCPRPVHVSKPAADEYVEGLVRGLIDGGSLGLVASARELEEARKAYEAARAERRAFVEKTAVLDAEDFDLGYAARKGREVELQHGYEELLARASEVDEMPTSAAAWDGLSFAGKRKVAGGLLDAVVVSPPLSRSPNADITLRFTPRWAHRG
jgi:hypothetical protein